MIMGCCQSEHQTASNSSLPYSPPPTYRRDNKEMKNFDKGYHKEVLNRLPSYRQCKNVEEKIECTICMHSLLEDENIKCLPCFHRFHVECIDTWLMKELTCPVCFASVVGTC